MNDLTEMQTSIARAAHVAHAIAVETIKHVDLDILNRYQRSKTYDTLSLEEALQTLNDIANMYGCEPAYEIAIRQRQLSIAGRHLRQSIKFCTAERYGQDAADAVCDALMLAGCMRAAETLHERETKQADDYLASAIKEAASVCPELLEAVCAAVGIQVLAWPIFITLVDDDQNVFQAAQAAEMLTHQ